MYCWNREPSTVLFLFTRFKILYGKNTHIALFACTYHLVICNLEKVGCEKYSFNLIYAMLMLVGGPYKTIA